MWRRLKVPALVWALASVLVAPLAAIPAEAAIQVWPGDQPTTTVDVQAQLGTDLSGLSYASGATAAEDVLWGVNNRKGLIHRLVFSDGAWRPDTVRSWSAGKKFTFPDGRTPDAEGLVVIDDDAWVSTERDGTGASRTSIVRVPLGGSEKILGQTQEWRLQTEFPGIGANAGLEAIARVPDAHLVEHGFRDESRDAVYDPTNYPDKVGGGVFFVAAEAASLKGQLRGYVLNSDGSFVRVANVTNPLGLVMDLEFEPAAGRLWISCDDDCDGRTATLELRSGSFVATGTYARPTGLPNHNNEGFAMAPEDRCSGGVKPVFWSNDSNNGGHALRAGTLRCDQSSDVALRKASVSVYVPQRAVGVVRSVSVKVSANGNTPTGEVIVGVAGRTFTARLVDGRAVITVGRFTTPGNRTVRVTYTGDATTAQAKASATLRTVKASTRLVQAKKRIKVGAR